ncbi:hypothetical protein [Zoogloea sp.]|uniref:hypothetical protein n=1 Tax=Zoogloea sp. TaxID=49181 RepID=UPI0035B26D17
MGIYLNDAELETLYRIEDCLVKTYVFIRSRMDRRTGRVGTVSGISYQAIAEHGEYEVRKGAGVQVVRLGKTPDEAQEVARRYVKRLIKAGLLVAIGGPVLCFLCAKADYGQVRPNQTHRERTTHLPTERTTPDATDNPDFMRGLTGLGVERTTHPEGQKQPNAPHIKNQGLYTSQSSSTTGREVAPGDAGAGVNRDRAAPSQAGLLGRPGETHDDPYRDRPVGSHVGPRGADFEEGCRDRPPASHPAQARRLAAEPDPSGASPGVQGADSARSSAENESFASGMPPDAEERFLRAVLDARGVRALPSDSAVLAGWVAAGISADELDGVIERARAARIKAGSTQSINLPYLAQIVTNDLAAARRAAARLAGDAPRAWRGGVADLEALARRLRISGARPGEDAAAFRARVAAAWNAQQGGGHGAA